MASPNRENSVALEVVESSPKHFRWSQPFEDTLLDLLVREARKGNRPDSTFTATTFRNVVTDFNSINGTTIMKKHVFNRIKTMKTHFHMFHGAFKGLSGFSWNPHTKMFEAEDYLWKQRIQENPKLQKFREKACHNWDKLAELYGDTRATGDGASSLKETSKNIKRPLQFDDLCPDSDGLNSGQFVNIRSSSSGDQGFLMEEGPHPRAAEDGSSLKSSGTSKSKHKRKLSLVAVMEEGYKSMAASIRELSMALVEIGELVASAKFDVSHNTSILEALSELRLDEAYRVRCYMYLSSKPQKAAVVVVAPKDLRRTLLSEIMAAVGA